VVALILLVLPALTLLGYLWGGYKEQRESIRNLTERQQVHAEMADSISSILKQGEEARRMTRIALREMRHPLTSIVGYSLTLQSYWDRLDEEVKKDHVKFLQVSASQLEVMVSDLMRITELARISPRVESTRVDLEELVAEVKSILEDIYKEKMVMIGLRFPQEATLLQSDPFRLFELLYNLFDFCMRCSDPQKTVSAWCSHQRDRLSLRIRCHNSSIPPDNLMKLREWPPSEEEEEAATMGMEYRLASHLTQEINGELKMDTIGAAGFSFLIYLPIA
jgi:K+-sensing histidine kinase KdpD